MALGKVLLEQTNMGLSEISWQQLSKGFLGVYIQRIDKTGMPQQATSGQLTKMERIASYSQVNVEQINYGEAANLVAAEGFNDVVSRFQTIGSDKEIVDNAFYEIEFGKRLIIKDPLLVVSLYKSKDEFDKIEVRWGLLEGAFSINHSAESLILANDIRETFLRPEEVKRANLTTNMPFLKGYQGNTRFYRAEEMRGTPQVDRVMSRQVIMHDQVCNLVLAHEECNLQESDKIIGPHFIKKLVFRNYYGFKSSLEGKDC